MPTFFNFLGPLTNPARVTAAAIGCADSRMAPVMAAVLAERGDTAMVFRGDDGLDELTTTTTSQRLGGRRRRRCAAATVDPARWASRRWRRRRCAAATRRSTRAVVRDVLAGAAAAVRDAVLLNAAAGIAAYDGLTGARLHDALAARDADRRGVGRLRCRRGAAGPLGQREPGRPRRLTAIFRACGVR